jgi:hypothetical protein
VEHSSVHVFCPGDAAKIVAGRQVYKYGETRDELGYDLIPCAIETYGKFEVP